MYDETYCSYWGNSISNPSYYFGCPSIFMSVWPIWAPNAPPGEHLFLLHPVPFDIGLCSSHGFMWHWFDLIELLWLNLEMLPPLLLPPPPPDYLPSKIPSQPFLFLIPFPLPFPAQYSHPTPKPKPKSFPSFLDYIWEPPCSLSPSNHIRDPPTNKPI